MYKVIVSAALSQKTGRFQRPESRNDPTHSPGGYIGEQSRQLGSSDSYVGEQSRQ